MFGKKESQHHKIVPLPSKLPANLFPGMADLPAERRRLDDTLGNVSKSAHYFSPSALDLSVVLVADGVPTVDRSFNLPDGSGGIESLRVSPQEPDEDCAKLGIVVQSRSPGQGPFLDEKILDFGSGPIYAAINFLRGVSDSSLQSPSDHFDDFQIVFSF